jgi:hypothetical protein
VGDRFERNLIKIDNNISRISYACDTGEMKTKFVHRGQMMVVKVGKHGKHTTVVT